MMRTPFYLNEPVKKARSTGFSLIELMIVVAIIAIISAVAFPAYKKQTLKGHRVDAKSAVLEAAAREEKFFATNNKYSSAATDLNYAAVPFDVLSGTQKVYVLNIAVNAAGSTYTITAIPQGDQQADACYTYAIDNFGSQTNQVSGGGANTTSGCW
jgi:type IV pilus assembly protein PilE